MDNPQLNHNNSHTRILGVDYGSSHTGLAVSDTMCITAQGIGTFDSTSMRKTAQHVAALAAEYSVCEIVVGYPKNMNNTIGERAALSEKFADMLGRICDVPVTLWDERLTTVSAIRTLNETNTRGKKRKAAVNTIAAVLILQNYLDYKRPSTSTPVL